VVVVVVTVAIVFYSPLLLLLFQELLENYQFSQTFQHLGSLMPFPPPPP